MISIRRIKNIFSEELIIIFSFLIISFLYAMFLLQSLPFYMYGYDDFQLVYDAIHLSFTDIAYYTFLEPLSFDKSFLMLGIHQRSIHGLFLKLSYLFSGLDPSAYYVLRAIFFSLSGVLVYLFTKKITNNKLISVITGVLYCSFPVTYDGLRYIGASESFSDFFMLTSIYFFLRFYKDQEKYTLKQKYFNLFIIFILILFSIKARETGILMLMSMGAFLIIKYKNIQENKMLCGILVLLSLYLLPLALSQFDIIGDEDNITMSIKSEKILSNMKNLLFYNSETQTGNGEKTLVIFSLKQYLFETPGSVLGSLGFVIVWYFIAMICIYSYYLWKNKHEQNNIPINLFIFHYNDYFLIFLLWFIFATLLMLIYVIPTDHHAIRYVGVMMTPLIIIIISFCYSITEFIKKLRLKYVSKNIVLVFLIILFLSIVVNVGITSINRRGGIGSRHMGMEQVARIIVQDLYNQSFDNSFFFAITEISGDGQYIPCKFSNNISLSNVTVTNEYFLSITKPITDENINISLSKYGFVYIISSSELPINNKYTDIQFVKRINPCQNSYYCNLKEMLKQQKIIFKLFEKQLSKDPKFFVYKIVRRNISYERPVKIICANKDGI